MPLSHVDTKDPPLHVRQDMPSGSVDEHLPDTNNEIEENLRQMNVQHPLSVNTSNGGHYPSRGAHGKKATCLRDRPHANPNPTASISQGTINNSMAPCTR